MIGCSRRLSRLNLFPTSLFLVIDGCWNFRILSWKAFPRKVTVVIYIKWWNILLIFFLLLFDVAGFWQNFTASVEASSSSPRALVFLACLISKSPCWSCLNSKKTNRRKLFGTRREWKEFPVRGEPHQQSEWSLFFSSLSKLVFMTFSEYIPLPVL